MIESKLGCFMSSTWVDAAANVIGLVGVIIILISYYFLNVGKVAASDMSYLWSNLVGSVLILISLWVHWNLPSFIIEVAWILISVIGMARSIKNKGCELPELKE